MPACKMAGIHRDKGCIMQAIKESVIIASSFEQYGKSTKISLTWHTECHAYTVQAWATITHARKKALHSWDQLPAVLTLHEFTGERICKENGNAESTRQDQAKLAQIFQMVCNEIDNRSDYVSIEQYQRHRK